MMRRRTITLLALFLLTGGPHSSFAQQGQDELHKWTYIYTHTEKKMPAAPPDKALVYILRPSWYEFTVHTWAFVDERFVGVTKGKNYTFALVDPGEHVFWAKAENVSALRMTVEGGKTYFLKQRIFPGVMRARMKLTVIDEANAQRALEKCEYVTPTEKANTWGQGMSEKRYAKAKKKAKLYVGPVTGTTTALAGTQPVRTEAPTQTVKLAPAPVTATESQKTDLSLSVSTLSPDSPATLAAGEHITVTLRYSFSKPKKVRIWALAGEGRYQSSKLIKRGRGEVNRFLFLTKPGKIDQIEISAKNKRGEKIYKDVHKVNYTYVSDPKKAHIKGDGVDSFVSNVRLSHRSPATLSLGTSVVVKMDYKLNTKYGLNLSVGPSTIHGEGCVDTSVSLELRGSGSTSRSFTIACPSHVDDITIRLENMVGEEVYKKIIPVDFAYK